MLDLQLVKKHLRVFHAREDDLIQLYIDAALAQFESFTERKLFEDQEALDAAVYSGAFTDASDVPEFTAILSKEIEQGAFLLIGYFYSERDRDAPMPRATELLWQSYRVIRFA